MKNNIFSFERFFKYSSYDLKRIISLFGPAYIVMTFFPIILYLFVLFISMLSGSKVTPDTVEPIRITIFAVLAISMVISVPSRLYGFVTDKKAGSAFAMLPASYPEKFLSMILNTLILVPLVYFVLYLISDAFICTLDSRVGETIFKSFTSLEIFTLDENEMGELQNNMPFALNFWGLYLTFAINVLTFLLGALFFKRRKITMTILCLFGLQVLLSLVIAGVIGGLSNEMFIDKIENYVKSGNFSLESFVIWANVLIGLWNCLWATALLAANYFRLKTIKY